MISQLALGVQLRDEATFDNFYVGDNQELVNHLKNFLTHPSENFIYLWGAPGSGRSHLLQACCYKINEQNLTAAFLPLTQAATLAPQILEDLETLALICIDDVDAIAGNPIWEEALFHCYNRLHSAKTRFIVTANAPPKLLNIKLADLASRLSAGLTLQLKNLNDEQKILALQTRAKIRGMELSKDVAQFLLTHYSRDTAVLFSILEKLDQASLAAQRKLTIPFVKLIVD